LGKYYGAPVYRLLGGKARDNIRVYNTTNGIGEWTNEKDIEKIAEYLLGRGIRAMKIWPFDPVARENKGSYISPTEIESNLDWIKRIRNAVGNEMEIAVEFHAYWNLPAAQRIAAAIEPYGIMWIEDIMFPENVEAYTKLCSETSIPVCISERLATRFPFARLLQEKACDIAMFDVTWCGGLTSGKKIADLADAYMVPSAPHTYGGPILWYASLHLAITLTNLWIMESGYYFYHDVYPGFLEEVIVPEQGLVHPPEEHGLGIQIKDGLLEHPDTVIEKIS
jgi:L-alanine-DL-glutamate epimerase-like enolase superfamily enzyme